MKAMVDVVLVSLRVPMQVVCLLASLLLGVVGCGKPGRLWAELDRAGEVQREVDQAGRGPQDRAGEGQREVDRASRGPRDRAGEGQREVDQAGRAGRGRPVGPPRAAVDRAKC